MLSDLQLAEYLQSQYNGELSNVPNAKVDFAILPDEDAIYLLFEGSHDIKDAMADLEAIMTVCAFGRVHNGAWQGLSESLPKTLPKDKFIVCSGHSLGAMRAQLAFRELYRLGYQDIKCISFECPRFGDREAINYGIGENRTYQNYNNLFEHDAFTMIPLHVPLEPYAEVPNCKRFWSAPTKDNEWDDWPVNIQAHSLSDCVIPYLKNIS